MAVPFKELAGSPVERFDSTGMTARREFLCAWQDRRALVEALLGDGYEFGGSARAGYPGTANVVAMRAAVEPLADDLLTQQFSGLTEGLNAYGGFAKVVVDYELVAPADRAALPAVAAGTFLTYRMEAAEQVISVPGDELVWEGSPTATFPVAASGEIRLPATRHRLTWHRVVNPPWATIRAAAGTLNNAEFLGAAAEAMLFEGGNASREFVRISELDSAEFAWCLEYVFLENPLVPAAGPSELQTSEFSELLAFAEEA